MILRLLASIPICAMTVACYVRISVKALDKCDCVCSETWGSGTLVCQVLSQLRKELSSVINEVERRTLYITQLEDMKARMESQDEMIRRLMLQSEGSAQGSFKDKSAPAFSNSAFGNGMGKDMMNILNETQLNIRNVENQLKNVTSFIKTLDVEGVVNSKLEIMNATFFNETVKALQDKVDTAVYKNETKKMGERLDEMGTNVSNLKNIRTLSQFSRKIHNLTKSLLNMNETVLKKVDSAVSRLNILETKIDKFKDLEKELKTRPEDNSFLTQLQSKVNGIQNSTKYIQKTLATQAARTSLALKHETAKQIEKFKAELIANCSMGFSSCFSPHNNQFSFAAHNNQTTNLNSNFMAELMRHFGQKVEDKLIIEKMFWGCEPIDFDNHPNLLVERHDTFDKVLTFKCAKNTRLKGIIFTECQDGLWVPPTPPICVSKSTYPSIWECPAINIDDNIESSLLLTVDVNRKRAIFGCTGNKLLQGPSFVQCSKGSWFPDIVPQCVSPYQKGF